MSDNLVFFLYRLGVKVYRIEPTLTVTQLIDIPTLDVEEISTKLVAYKDTTVRLLISDSISYLFHTQVSLGTAPISRDLVLAKIKTEIPEKIEAINWDFKVNTIQQGIADVVVFAPVSEFQSLITDISNRLKITFETLEPESIASTRHPDPVVGITKKEDLSGSDEQTLNLVVAPPKVKTRPSLFGPILAIAIIIIFICGNLYAYSLYTKSLNKPVVSATPTSTPTSVPTQAPTPTVAVFNLAIQNGTKKTGYAFSIGIKFTAAGFTNITTGNADNKNYSTSKLIFRDSQTKSTYLDKINSVLPITEANVSVDKTINFDAILILGNN